MHYDLTNDWYIADGYPGLECLQIASTDLGSQEQSPENLR
jgi:hypothetical protein